MKKKIFCIFMILLLFSVGCAKNTNEESKFGMVKITPSKLFQGDTKRLEPHLGLTTGCVEIDYKGNKKMISCKYEIWEKGKKVNSYGIMSSRINGEYHGEVSISLREMFLDNLERSDDIIMKTALSSGNGYSSSTKFLKRYDYSNSSGTIPLNETIEVKDHKEIAVWAHYATDSQVYASTDDIEEMASKVDWAVVLKVFLQDEIEVR